MRIDLSCHMWPWQILSIRIAAGDMDVAEHVTDEAELPLAEQSRVFREQVGKINRVAETFEEPWKRGHSYRQERR